MKLIDIKNGNGSNYFVLDSEGDYTLLVCHETLQFVVVWKNVKYGDVYSWGQGHYFDNIIDAVDCYKEKVMR